MSLMVVEEVSNKNYKKQLHRLADQVIVLQEYQKKLKKQLKVTEQIIMNLNLKNRLNKLLIAIEQEKATYFKMLVVFRQMESTHQIPYLASIRQYTQIINEHHEHFQAAKKDPLTHNQQIASHKEIWQQQDKSEHIIFFVARGLLGLIGAFLIHLLIGGLYRWGMVNAFVTSYYKITNNPDLTMPIDSINTPLSMLFVTLSMRIGTVMKQYLGIIPVLFFSLFGMSINIYISGFMPTIQLFSVFHIAGYGLAAGMSFTITIKEMISYFPEWKIYINTIILTGTGLGAALFGVQNSQCMNPKDYYPLQTGYYSGELDSISYRMPLCITQMSLLVAFLGGFGILCMFPVIFYNIKTRQQQQKQQTKQDFQFACHTTYEAFQSYVFWAILVIIILSSCGNFYIVSNYKGIVKDEIQDVVFLDFVFVIGCLFNGTFRLIWGLAISKFGLKFLYILAMLLNIFVFGMIPLVHQYRQAYLFLYAINSVVAGGQIVIFASMSILVFGSYLGQDLFSFYMLAFTLANFGNFAFGRFLDPLIGDYVFLVFGILSFLGVILIIRTKLQGNWQNPMNLLTLQIPILS